MKVFGRHVVSVERVNWRRPTPSMASRPWSTWQLVVGPSYRPLLKWQSGRFDPDLRPLRCVDCGAEPGSKLGEYRCERALADTGGRHRFDDRDVFAPGY